MRLRLSSRVDRTPARPLRPLVRRAVLAATLAVAGAAGACLPTVSNPREYHERPISAEAGATYFLETGGGDPYATGMAYPVFLAMMEGWPNELGKDFAAFADKFGFVPDPAAKGDPWAPPLGFHRTTDPNSDVPWLVANCQMCHTERLRLPDGDVVVPGLGNKGVRPHAYASALLRIAADPGFTTQRIEQLATARARALKVPWGERARPYIVKATVEGLKEGAKRRRASLARFEHATPGRMATIESFALVLAEQTHRAVPTPDPIGWTKVPDVRSFPFRDTFSYDGSGYGSPQALVLEADFLFGTRPEWYRTHQHIATSMYLYLKTFRRDLRFPGALDAAKVARGKGAFERSCASCHGLYVDHGDENRVSYREKIVPLEVVGTDAARANAVSPAFVDAANAYPLVQGLTRVRHTGGYVPPILLDVWARGVFGHAGQWPSLEALATPPAARPRRFVVDTKGFYDLERVGVRYEAVHEAAGEGAPRALRDGEYLYDGTVPGYGVEGHPFLSDLADDERAAVIEYLKTI